MKFFNNIKYQIKIGNALLRLIFFNVGLFIFVNLIHLFAFLFGFAEMWQIITYKLFYFPHQLTTLIYQPWTLFTYMFMHADLWHILFNMLWLYWLGQIFLIYLSTRQLVTVYFLGGIIGAFFYTLIYTLLPIFNTIGGTFLVGASASVMAIVIGISAFVPNYIINLLFIGPVRLKYIALFTILIDLISIPHGNAGGHISHLGGALFGLIFGLQMRKGRDITLPFQYISVKNLKSIFRRKSKLKVMYRRPVNDYEYNKNKIEMQKELDRILDKISKSGYDSLTKNEKDFLFKSGNH